MVYYWQILRQFIKKDEATDKENRRPMSVLPLFSKIFEKVIYNQLSQYPEKFFGKLIPRKMLYSNHCKHGKKN